MKFTNKELKNYVNRIKLRDSDMGRYRDQITHLKNRLTEKIDTDESTGVKVTKFIIAGSWKKRTILRATGDHPIDVDLVLYVEGDESFQNDLEGLHDFVFGYLSEIYPTKDVYKDVDAEGRTKSIKIRFVGTGLELDIVPVVPIDEPENYVWQPERGGGGKYISSVTNQLNFFKTRRLSNPSISAVVRVLKWWRNYKELKPSKYEPGFSSFAIELICSYLDIERGVEENIEEGIIRFLQFVSSSDFKVIAFDQAINTLPTFTTPIFVADPTNNENNVAKKMTKPKWDEIKREAFDAWESLNIAQSKGFYGETVREWKHVFGPSFNIEDL